MPQAPWDDTLLDRMRTTGDPPADRAVAALFAAADRAAVERLLGSLTRNDSIVSEALPAEIRDYLASIPQVPEPEAAAVVEGQQLFADYGPEILMILACYSLPASYAARKGVQVLYRTGFLANRPNRRLFQTAQMVIDVMTPGGLGRDGRGRATAEKVRLMHAAIRHLLLDGAPPWPADLGVPINQEDLAGTLMTFTSIILDGLGKLGIHVSPAHAGAYLEAWQAVGRMMGIVDELIPRTVDDAAALMAIIERRQVEPCDEGRALTASLLEMLEGHTPPGLKGVPPALMRTLLPAPVADALGVPHSSLEEHLVRAGISIGHALDVLTGSAVRRRVFRQAGLHFIQACLSFELGGRPAFRIPLELHDRWRTSNAAT